MTTSDFINALQSSNEDLIAIRVSGSVKMTILPPEIQRKLNGNDAREVLDQAVAAAQKGI
jgi:hypothetical protein